jgi:DNA-binding NarL/FixJ family response regulator
VPGASLVAAVGLQLAEASNALLEAEDRVVLENARALAAGQLPTPGSLDDAVAAAHTFAGAIRAASGRGRDNPDRLTPREIDVLRLLASGRTNAEAAAALNMSVRTVERHISNLYGKIGARNRSEATAYALRHRL